MSSFHSINIMMVVFIRKSCVIAGKVASRFIQDTLWYSRMGSSFSRSYSPNTQGGQGCSTDENRGTISRMESTSNYVESVVCHENDLNDNEMKVFDIGNDEGKVLLVRQKGEFSAIGTTCTHYGAPLVSGALGNGRVRCPWHGACFNTKTGDIEDFPGFDSLPCYQVTVTDKGEVKVRAKLSDLKSKKRIKDNGMILPCEGSVAVIVGGGPSGATCAEALRSEGFKGRISMVCKENYLPYDRIKVSKIGTVTEIEKLQARTNDYYKNANIEILKGISVEEVDTKNETVHLSNGNKLRYDFLYLATGSSPRLPNIPGINLGNIFTVRNFDDSMNILNTLGNRNNMNVVVLGLSFIGLEIASSCADKANTMTVVGRDTAPLGRIFGNEIGNSLRRLFEEKGVTFHFETTISKCIGRNGVITSVELTNGTTLPADMLILGVGTTLNTGFLAGSGLEINQDGSVNVNEKLETNIKNVYAGGDIAHAPVFAANNEKMSIGHVGLAQYHGRIAALNMLKKETTLKTVPFFWTMLFGKSIRYCGYGKPVSTQIEGNVDELKFVIYFFDSSSKVIAVASCMRDPVVAQFAEYTNAGKSLYKKDLTFDAFGWTKAIN